MARRGSDKRRPRPPTKRHYPRTARLNALLREIVADFVERIDDDRLGFLTVTGVEVDADLNRAEIFISALDTPSNGGNGVESSDEKILKALASYRKPLQAEIARSARLRKTPEAVFMFDPAVREGARIEDIISTLNLGETPEEPSGESSEKTPEEPSGDTRVESSEKTPQENGEQR